MAKSNDRLAHHCHALGCKNSCPPAHLMCRSCWAQVPADLGREVVDTCKQRGKSIDATWAPWWRAAHRAIHHVAMLREPNQERGDMYLAKEMAFADRLEKKAEESPHASGRRIVKQSNAEFWAAIRKSADLVRGLPAWTQGGIVLSDNFEGGVKARCNGTGKEYRGEDGRDGNSK